MKIVGLIYISLFVLTGIQNTLSNSFLSSILSVFSILLITIFAQDKQWMEKELYNRLGLKRVFLSIILSILCVLTFHLLWDKFFSTVKFRLLKIQGVDFFDLMLMVLSMAFICLIEELIFRGYFQEEFKKRSQHLSLKLSAFYQIMTPAILFALMHFFNMGPSCIIILIPGVIFGCLKYYSSNIYASASSHFIFNLYYISLMEPRPF